MDELKSKVEAILICVQEGIDTKKLAEQLNLGSPGQVKQVLHELQKEYDERSSGFRLVEENGLWKIKILDEYTEIVKDAALPELDKAVLETLAYIAFRGGSRQCDVVRVRSNKAYRHIRVLLEQEFIESEKTGLTKFLSLSKKFYRYFNLKDNQKIEIKSEEQKPAEQQNTPAAATEPPKIESN